MAKRNIYGDKLPDPKQVRQWRKDLEDPKKVKEFEKFMREKIHNY